MESMKANQNSIKAVKVPAAIVATEVYFVPGVGEIEAADLEDLRRKLEEIKRKEPVTAEKVEEGDGN